MLAHYAAETIARARGAPFAAAVRVLTLAAGVACFITAQTIAAFWGISDRHFTDADRIFAVSTNLAFTNGTLSTAELPLTNEHVRQYLESDFPSLAVARARVISEAAMVSADERAVRLFRVDVDPEFLEIFTLTFVAGDAKRALREPGSVVLTQEAAVRLFDDQPALGRRVRLSNSVDGFVTGVVSAIPEPSHMGRSATASLRFDMLVARERPRSLPGAAETGGAIENWLVLDHVTYVSLPADGSLSARDLRRQLGAFASAHVPREQLDLARLEFGLIPVTDLLVRAGSSGLFVARTGFTVTAALSLLGAVVLAIACANYASLTTAAALARARGVAVHKAVGATPLQIAGQQLFDASVFAGAAFLVASAAVIAMIPTLRQALGIDIRLVLLGPGSLAFLAALLPVVALLGGLYPAITLARQPPIAGLPERSTRVRLASSVFASVQFAAASFLLVAAIVTYLQNTALARNLEDSRDPLLLVENHYTATGLHPETLRGELQALEHTVSVTSIARPPWSGVNVLPLGLSPTAGVPQRSAIWYTVGHDFFATLGIELLAGRVFDRARGDDALPFLGSTAQANNIVIDRTLARELGFASPLSAIDEIVYIPRELTAGFGATAAQPLRVIGVVENRLLTLTGAGARGSVYSFAEPLPFQIARIAYPHVTETLAEVDALWKELVPSVALRRQFVHDLFLAKSAGPRRVNRALTVLTLFAYGTSAIGLYSMTKLSASRRRREIAVRKILGATTARVATLMLASLARPVVAANLLALPVAYVAARAYLRGFVEPIPLGVLPFALGLVITLFIVGCTVLADVVRVAASRPTLVLRQY